MSWSYFPDGKLETKSDDGVPVGSHSVVTDNSTTGLAKATGTWDTWWTAPDQQGTSYRTHAAASSSTDEFTWTLDVPADGTYSLAVTYPQASGAATDATFELTHGVDGDGHGGEVTEPAYVVDQTTGAGAWNDVGQVELRKGDPVAVTLVPSATGKVVADAVRLVRDNAADTDTEARAFAYSYDVNGNLTGINDTSSGARADDYQVTYTGLNQVASVKEALSGQDTATTSYTYDVLGQPVTVDHPDQASTYEYQDPRHLLTSVSVDDLDDTAGAKVTGYTYDNRGMRATETKANGNVVTNGYFLDGALKSLREEKSGGALVFSHTYTYDANGNKHTDVASKANADVAGTYLESTTTYSYDPVDRLAESVKTGNGAKTETYVHDDNANVISQNVGGTATTYTYDRNRLLTATADGAAASYRYDPFGRQTSVVSAGQTISRTTYDGFDHIAQSEKTNDAGELESTTYAYDPLDRTASKTSGTGESAETTDYTYLGLSSEVLGEEVAGQLTKSYQYSPWGQRLSQITHQADLEAGVEAGESAYYGYNAHTDVETLTDDTGNTVATYGYTAYGNADESEYTGIDKPEAGTPEDAEPYNAYRYNSKRWDAGSGTYDMGFRDYAPGLNRFTTRDMYNGALANMILGSDPYSGNRYAFTAGNPISRIEQDGHWWEALPKDSSVAASGTVASADSDGPACKNDDCDGVADWRNESGAGPWVPEPTSENCGVYGTCDVSMLAGPNENGWAEANQGPPNPLDVFMLSMIPGAGWFLVDCVSPVTGSSTDCAIGGALGALGAVGGGAKATGNAIDAANESVDLASAQRRTHILDGDHTGGGHRWPGAPGKTPFPRGWSDDEIMHHVSDIATDPKANWTGGGPRGSVMTRRGNPARFSVFGNRGGTCIKVVVEPAGEGIITAHPATGSC
jgi:RHS repeat-associated protein